MTATTKGVPELSHILDKYNDNLSMGLLELSAIIQEYSGSMLNRNLITSQVQQIKSQPLEILQQEISSIENILDVFKKVITAEGNRRKAAGNLKHKLTKQGRRNKIRDDYFQTLMKKDPMQVLYASTNEHEKIS
jgi:hypothetical protein